MVDFPVFRQESSDLFFADDKKNILVLLGIDGGTPPKDIQTDLEEMVNMKINTALKNAGADIDATRQTVKLTVGENPSRKQRDTLGGATLTVFQFDVKTELDEVSMSLVNATHNTIVEQVDSLGFNIEGTETKVV